MGTGILIIKSEGKTCGGSQGCGWSTHWVALEALGKHTRGMKQEKRGITIKNNNGKEKYAMWAGY